MKTKTILLGAAFAAAFVTNQSVRADDLFAAAAKASIFVNRPVAASPHALEEFTWLLKPSMEQEGTRAHSNAVLAAIRKNKAFATSPRVLEQYPELLRSGTSPHSPPREPFAVPAEVLKNEAWARSPRVLELYPWLEGYNGKTRNADTATIEQRAARSNAIVGSR